MALEDFVDPEVGIAVAATAMVFSPRVRNALRRGAVYGLAGVLKASDSVASAARGVANQAQQTAGSGSGVVQEITTEAKTVARGGKGSRAAQAE